MFPLTVEAKWVGDLVWRHSTDNPKQQHYIYLNNTHSHRLQKTKTYEYSSQKENLQNLRLPRHHHHQNHWLQSNQTHNTSYNKAAITLHLFMLLLTVCFWMVVAGFNGWLTVRHISIILKITLMYTNSDIVDILEISTTLSDIMSVSEYFIPLSRTGISLTSTNQIVATNINQPQVCSFCQISHTIYHSFLPVHVRWQCFHTVWVFS